MRSTAVDDSRRTFLRRGAAALGVVAATPILAACDIPYITKKTEAVELPVEDGEEALKRLMEGNKRYAKGKSTDINESLARRAKVVKRQRPFAMVFSCVDSRVPPELVFDRGLGDLFVIRTAGEVVDSAVMGSLEYGAYELEIPLLLVLGHEKCGAVKATMEAVASGGEVDGSIGYLVDALRPAVENTPSELALTPEIPMESGAVAAPAAEQPGSAAKSSAADETTAAEDSAADAAAETTADETTADETSAEETTAEETTADGEVVTKKPKKKSDPLAEAIARNVTMTVAKVSASPIIADRIAKDRLIVVGGIYDLDTGVVKLTDNVPESLAPKKTTKKAAADTTVA